MLIVLLCLVISVRVHGLCGDCKNFRCDYKYYKHANGFLKFHSVPAIWHEAELRCNLEGAVLASPLNNHLVNAMQHLLASKCPKCEIYTGIHATFSRGDFHSVEGVPLRKMQMKRALGKFGYENKCMIQQEDELVDVPCKHAYPYICYKKDNNITKLNECGTVDNEYHLYKTTKKCYKFHKNARTWSRAYMACAAELAHLAIINSEAEAQVVRDLFGKHPAINPRFVQQDIAFIGFHDWGEHGIFRTVQGESLAKAGYDKFASGQPDNATNGEFCGAAFRNGLLDDLWCENKYAFICEREPVFDYMCGDEEENNIN